MDFKKLFETLPEEERAILLLYYQQSFTVEEISQKLQVPNRAVVSVLRTGRARLIAALEPDTGSISHDGDNRG